MKIGDIDISLYQARQHTMIIGHSKISNASEWNPGAVLPFFAKNAIGMKDLEVSLIVKGDDREDILHNVSGILSILRVPVELTLDRYAHKFHVILDSYKHEEMSMRRWHKLTLQFSGYEFSEMQTFAGGVDTPVANPGNLPSPCAVQITQILDAQTLTIRGINRDSFTGVDIPVKVTGLRAGQSVILNGITGLVTLNGMNYAKNVEMWQLPSILPGVSTVTCDIEAAISITVLPLYM